MDWTVFTELRELLDTRQAAPALRRLAAIRRGSGDGLPGPLATLEAEALLSHGEPNRASAALQECIDAGRDDFWTWYNLAVVRRELRDSCCCVVALVESMRRRISVCNVDDPC